MKEQVEKIKEEFRVNRAAGYHLTPEQAKMVVCYIDQLEKQVAELEEERHKMMQASHKTYTNAIEECAKVANSFKYKFPTEPHQVTTNVVCEDIKTAIRKLKQEGE